MPVLAGGQILFETRDLATETVAAGGGAGSSAYAVMAAIGTVAPAADATLAFPFACREVQVGPVTVDTIIVQWSADGAAFGAEVTVPLTATFHVYTWPDKIAAMRWRRTGVGALAQIVVVQ